MTRRDLIIVAVLVNTALLAVLFMMAISTDEEKINDPTEFTQISQIKPTEVNLEPLSQSTVYTAPTGDEGDNALRAVFIATLIKIQHNLLILKMN